ncbi:MAG TPA: hypothetical protein VF426_00515, partial [Marmoricola sp.]
MTSRSWHRLGGIATALAVGAALAAVTAPADAAAASPESAGANWLAAQLSNGAVVGQYGADYGLSVDTAVALQAAGGHASDVNAVAGTLKAHINDYITGDAFGDTGST